MGLGLIIEARLIPKMSNQAMQRTQHFVMTFWPTHGLLFKVVGC